MSEQMTNNAAPAGAMPEGGLPPIAVRSIRNQTALSLNEPDRVPFMPSMNNFYAMHYGVSIKDSMTDARTLIEPLRKFCADYNPDWVWNPVPFPIKPMETIGHKQARWPGEYWNLPDDTPYQYVDKCYLTEDDWDEYFKDPSYYLLTRVIPEKYEALGALKMLSPYAMCNQAILSYMPFGLPPVQEALKALIKTGQEVMDFMQGGIELTMSVINNGYPVYGGAPTMIPFDYFADCIRGLMELCMDLVTDPDVVDEAIQKVGDIIIPAGIQTAKMSNCQDLFLPLHCGVDNFMSVENYEKHYWPSLKRTIEAAIAADLTPIVFCEGRYNTRLDCITDVPKGKVLYVFEEVDLKEAKRIVGPYAAIGGGMNTHTLMNGTPERVEREVRETLEYMAPGGGYFMCNSIALDQVSPENMHAWRDAVEKYGYYK